MTNARTSQKGHTKELGRAEDLPSWVPEATRHYLAHTEGGETIREIARRTHLHPSTVLRQVRKVELQRDDPLVDSALRTLAVRVRPRGPEGEEALEREALPALRRLAEPDAVLAVARDMEKGVIAREEADCEPQRLMVVDRRLAEAMALRDWIAGGPADARVRRYRITNAGRAMLRRVGPEPPAWGLAEAPAAFAGPTEDDRLRHMRSALVESPLVALSRRRDGDGKPFLSREMIAAGDRLREDFDLAQTAPSPPDWDAFLERLPELGSVPSQRTSDSRVAARLRVERALLDLGPGLADVALRCCCLLEGVEHVERRLAWSARSGKVVLRIALTRLAHHYRQIPVRAAAVIG